MSLQTQIQEDIKKAMIAKDSVKLTTLRGVSATFTNEILAKKVAGNALPDADAVTIIKRLVKQRKDSIEQFEKGGRADLVANEKAELAVLEEYLPKMMSRDEIKKIAVAVQKKTGIADKTKMGQLMGAVIKETKGMADGADVKAVVEELFK